MGIQGLINSFPAKFFPPSIVLCEFFRLGVDIKSGEVHAFSILYGQINVPLAGKELIINY